MFDLKRFRKDYKLTQEDVAKLFACKQSNISGIEKTKKDLESYQEAILIDKYGVNIIDEYSIDLGVLEDISDNIDNSIEECICEKQPIIDISVCAGSGIGLEGKENKVIDWVAIPSFKGCTGITVYGDSMFDKYRSGDIIFIRPIISPSDIDYGQCYVVVTREDRIMKNIYESNKGDDFVCMTSYNTATNPDGRRVYPDRDIHKSDICFLYKVVGKLERNQM